MGGPAFNLGVTGSNFHTGASGAVVRSNDTDLPTTRDSATHLTAAVPATLIAAAGSATITVRNGLAGAPLSNGLPFTVANPVPIVTALSPAEVWAGYVKDDLVLSVEGGNFLPGAHVFLNDAERADTSFVSASRLRVPLRAADLVRPGRLLVTVKNPPLPPGTASSGALQLLLVPETTTPTVTIDGADAGWHNRPVPLTFSATDGQSGVQKLQYRSPPAVDAWSDGSAYTVPLTSQGANLVSVRALDWCHGVGTAAATVNIDATPPTTAALKAVSVRKGTTAQLRFRVLDPTNLSPSARVVLMVKRAKGGETVKTLTVDDAPTNATLSAACKANFKAGAYRWYVYATDLAGNAQANVASQKFTVK